MGFGQGELTKRPREGVNPLLGRGYIGLGLEGARSKKNLKLDKREFIALGTLHCDIEFNIGKVPGDANLTQGWPLKIKKKCCPTVSESEVPKLSCRGRDQVSQEIRPAMIYLLGMTRKPMS